MVDCIRWSQVQSPSRSMELIMTITPSSLLIWDPSATCDWQTALICNTLSTTWQKELYMRGRLALTRAKSWLTPAKHWHRRRTSQEGTASRPWNQPVQRWQLHNWILHQDGNIDSSNGQAQQGVASTKYGLYRPLRLHPAVGCEVWPLSTDTLKNILQEFCTKRLEKQHRGSCIEHTTNKHLQQ